MINYCLLLNYIFYRFKMTAENEPRVEEVDSDDEVPELEEVQESGNNVV